jgi:hypothetical protein
MVYAPENEEVKNWEGSPEAFQEFMQFGAEYGASGKMSFAERLHDSSTATSVRKRDGKVLTTDGPFAETKEILGGIYVLEAENLDEAIEAAAKIPSVRFGTIEVRPIFEPPAEMLGDE